MPDMSSGSSAYHSPGAAAMPAHLSTGYGTLFDPVNGGDSAPGRDPETIKSADETVLVLVVDDRRSEANTTT